MRYSTGRPGREKARAVVAPRTLIAVSSRTATDNATNTRRDKGKLNGSTTVPSLSRSQRPTRTTITNSTKLTRTIAGPASMSPSRAQRLGLRVPIRLPRALVGNEFGRIACHGPVGLVKSPDPDNDLVTARRSSVWLSSVGPRCRAMWPTGMRRSLRSFRSTSSALWPNWGIRSTARSTKISRSYTPAKWATISTVTPIRCRCDCSGPWCGALPDCATDRRRRPRTPALRCDHHGEGATAALSQDLSAVVF